MGRQGPGRDDEKEKQKHRGKGGLTSKDQTISKKMKSREKADRAAVGPPAR